MLLGDIETFYADDAWRNRVEGSGATALAYHTQAEAAEVDREEPGSSFDSGSTLIR